MPPRFYLPELDATGRGALDEDEGGHLTRVLRLGPGAEIDVFDGRGAMHRARVVAADRKGVIVQALSPSIAAPEPAVGVTVAVAVLKGDKMDAVVRDVAMMGAAAVQPLVTTRSEVSLAALTRSERVERWRRIAIGGVKQSGRARVPAVNPPVSLPAWLAASRDEPLLALTEPSAGRGRAIRDVPRAPAVRLVIGPEGGWSAADLAALEAAGAIEVVLGGRTLRADAVPLVAMAALFEAWQAW